jgi:hypothetical protein
MKRTVVASLVLSLWIPLTGPPAQGVEALSPFLTRRDPQLVALKPKVQIIPLITAGDVIGGSATGYQMSGVPDGIGVYRSSASTVEVLLNHELALADDDPSDSRISHLTLNNEGETLAARYEVTGREGFEEFCSSTLEKIGGVPWYFTGEEAPKSARLGSSIALNADTGRWVETPHFGHMFHENNVPVRGLDRAVVFIAEDAAAGRAQIYAYFADSFRGAIRGTGSLRTWVPNRAGTDRDPSPDDISKGGRLRGRFEIIPQSRNETPDELDEAADALDAFDFVRIEDATTDPGRAGIVYFADTGAAHKQTFRGRIYRLRIDPDRPSHAVLRVVLDGDDGDDMFNPDNLGMSDEALVIQEDRNYARSGYNRVLVYDPSDGSLRAVARTDPRPIAIKRDGGPGAWESSGVVDASAFFGDGWWLLDVQAGDVKVSVPGPSLEPNTAEGEGGQLLLVYIPRT